MILIKLIAIFFVGFVFAILGFSICKFYKWKYIKGYLLLLIGFIIMYIPTFGPLSKSHQRIDEIQKIHANKIERIIIKTAENSHIEDTITDRKKNNEICNALRDSEITEESFMKNTKTIYIMEILMKNSQKINLELKFGEQITCLSVNSNGIFSWNYGKLKSKLIQNIIKK